jgi:hypothetical protein
MGNRHQTTDIRLQPRGREKRKITTNCTNGRGNNYCLNYTNSPSPQSSPVEGEAERLGNIYHIVTSRHRGLPLRFTIYNFYGVSIILDAKYCVSTQNFNIQFTIHKNNHVIANEVKQSHKSKYRLLRRFTPRNNIFQVFNSRFTIYGLRFTSFAIGSCNLSLDTCN